MKRLQTLLSIFAACLLLLPSVATAAVTVSDLSGTLVVTTLDGDINLYEPGDNFSGISSNSLLEVFDGSLKVSIEEGDTIQISCLGHEGTSLGPAAIELMCEETTGKIRAVKNSVNISKPDGESLLLEEGGEFLIGADEAAEAPATAQGRRIGLERALDAPAVDGTSIDQRNQQLLQPIADSEDQPNSPSL